MSTYLGGDSETAEQLSEDLVERLVKIRGTEDKQTVMAQEVLRRSRGYWAHID